MGMPEAEGKKAELMARIDRLRELAAGDAPADELEWAYREVGRSMDGLTRPGRAEGTPETPAGDRESPPGL